MSGAGSRVRRAGLARVLAMVVVMTLVAAVTPVAASADPTRGRRSSALEPVGLAQQIARFDDARRARDTAGAAIVPGSLLVTMEAATAERGWTAVEADVRALAGAKGLARLTDTVGRVDVAPDRADAVVAGLRTRPGVLAVEPVHTYERLAVPDDADYSLQWSHQIADAESAWDVTVGSSDVRVGVIDSGVVGTHPDLAGNLVEQIDVGSGTLQRRPLGSDNERCGPGFSHGTFVAGVLGADGNNRRAIAGTAWNVGIVDISVFETSGNSCFARDDRVVLALDYATQQRLDVVNLSLGGVATACPTAVQSGIDRARAAGVVVVAAAGNEGAAGAGRTAVPASCNGVISVGAVGKTERLARYSNSNPHIDLVAPGGEPTEDPVLGQITSLIRSGDVGRESGTSFAAPYVAGVAALLRTVSRELTPDQVESLMERTAKDLGASGRDDQHGWGLVQAGAAVRLAVELGADVPPPIADPAFPVGQGTVGSTRPPAPDPVVIRVAPDFGGTDPIRQAVAMSDAIFDEGGALHAVLARDDDYADALAGSALGFGVGPLLFSRSTGPLAPATATELQRVLAPGATVYLLGGSSALPETIEAEVTALGFVPVRLRGAGREDTAVRISFEVDRVVASFGLEPLPLAIVVTRQNWPDAVAAGALAARFGIPILLTPPGSLHPSTDGALRQRRPEFLYIVGGPGVVSEQARSEAALAAGRSLDDTARLAGPERTATAIAVAEELEDIFAFFGRLPAFAIAANLRRADGFAHVLSASALAGAVGAVFVPVEGEGGTILTQRTRDYVTGFGIDGVVAGGQDLISDGVEQELRSLLGAR